MPLFLATKYATMQIVIAMHCIYSENGTDKDYYGRKLKYPTFIQWSNKFDKKFQLFSLSTLSELYRISFVTAN